MSKTISIKKGTILESQGTVNSRVYKVITGLLRSYVIDEKGKEHIFLFAPEGWTIADSQPIDAPSDLFIDALEDSVVEVHSKENGHNKKGLYIKFRFGNDFLFFYLFSTIFFNLLSLHKLSAVFPF